MTTRIMKGSKMRKKKSVIVFHENYIYLIRQKQFHLVLFSPIYFIIFIFHLSVSLSVLILVFFPFASIIHFSYRNLALLNSVTKILFFFYSALFLYRSFCFSFPPPILVSICFYISENSFFLSQHLLFTLPSFHLWFLSFII